MDSTIKIHSKVSMKNLNQIRLIKGIISEIGIYTRTVFIEKHVTKCYKYTVNTPSAKLLQNSNLVPTFHAITGSYTWRIETDLCV